MIRVWANRVKTGQSVEEEKKKEKNENKRKIPVRRRLKVSGRHDRGKTKLLLCGPRND